MKSCPHTSRAAYKPNVIIQVVLLCENHSTWDTFKAAGMRIMELAMEYKTCLGAERLAACFTSQLISHRFRWNAHM
jgi:hypothetical protein